MLRSVFFVLLCLAPSVEAKNNFSEWHTTHFLDKFPCMNDKETQYFTRLINVKQNEERKEILADHRRELQLVNRRAPASVTAKMSPEKILNKNYICPPFRGVRNPHPQVIEFGKASTFERIRLADGQMQILNGLSRNEKWDVNYNNQKGYFEGKTPRGTPMNLIPLIPEKGEGVRFIIQYLLWQDKTPPTLTLCYREDLHNQCNPYKKPEDKVQPTTVRQPASAPAKKGITKS